MPKLIWTPAALREMQRLDRFLRQKSPESASRSAAAIRGGMNMIARQAAIGRPVEHLPHEYREWVIDYRDSGYVARYRLEESTAVILAIRHQREAGY